MSEAPALGYSIVANLGDNRQITAQCFVAHDEPLSVVNDHIDKVMRVIDRQRATYQIKELQTELDTLVATKTRAEDDLARVEEHFVADQTRVDVQLQHLANSDKEIREAALARGRGGPVGGEAARAKAIKAEQTELVELKARAKAERDQARQNLAISIGRYEENIEASKAKIADCRALIEGE